MTRPVGIGVIGAGYIARRAHLPAFQKLANEGRVQLVAASDVSEASAKSAAEEFAVPHAFQDYRKMLRLDAVDAVVVCTPNFLHRQPVLDAFAAGKHVLCEKPLAINGTEGAEMVEAGRRAGKQLQVAFNWRYHAGAQAVKRFIDDGRIGEIYYARAHALRRRGIPGWGVFTQKDKQGGGPLIDMGVHILDLTLWLMGHPTPVSVSGMTYTQFGRREGIIGLRGQWDRTKYTVEDYGIGFVRFDTGATLSLEASFAANLERDIFQTNLVGTEGGVHLDPLQNAATRLFREESGTLTDASFASLRDANMHEVEIRAFVDAIQQDTPGPVSGEQALTATRILDAIYESAQSGQEVLLNSQG